MRKTAFLKKGTVVLDFSEFPDREVVEYLVHVSYQLVLHLKSYLPPAV